MFNAKQIDFLVQLGCNFDFDNLSDDELVNIEEKVSLKLQTSGFDKDYNVTHIGELCESILDVLP